MTDPLQHWAMIQAKLKKARNAVLEAEGLTESGLREMEDEAQVHIPDVGDTVETEWGRVQMIYDKPVAFQVRQGGIMWKHKLKFTLKEE